MVSIFLGRSQVGKAMAFEAVMHRFESYRPKKGSIVYLVKYILCKYMK
jgi:hypothetical protein